jgi:hypothetical protein
VIMHGTLDPSDHDDQQAQLDDMQAIVKSVALVLEMLFGYTAVRPVPRAMIVDTEGL